ncbi:DegT/DnrJ/EryC1/StrS family aminotransferase [Candidatus Aenigmatarchaeota archaeon]
MNEWKIPLFKIHWDENDIEKVSKAIERGMFWAIGPEIAEFEKLIATHIGKKHVTLFNSGTSSLHASMLVYGINQGDEVIVPSFSFIATANAPLFVGAKPIFADIEEETFGLDPDSVREKITDKTKAIIPAHYGGNASHIKELREIADENNILLIEDACESLGASVNNEKIGSFGDSSILSFCSNKVISTGEGGAVATDSEEIYEKLKILRSHGRDESKNYFSTIQAPNYVKLGYNLRMPNILAALGISQIKKLDKIIQRRREIAKKFSEGFSDIDEIKLPIESKGHFHTYQMFSIRLENSKRDNLLKHLSSKGIMSNIFFNPIHETKFYKDGMKYDVKLPVTDNVSKEILSLPIYPDLKEDEINLIIDEVRGFLRG